MKTVVVDRVAPELSGSASDVYEFARLLNSCTSSSGPAQALRMDPGPALAHLLPWCAFRKWSQQVHERMTDRFDRTMGAYLAVLQMKLPWNEGSVTAVVNHAAAWWVDYLHPIIEGGFPPYEAELYCAFDKPEAVFFKLRLVSEGELTPAEKWEAGFAPGTHWHVLAEVHGEPRRCRAWPDVIAVATALEYPLIELAAKPDRNFTYNCAGQILVRCGDYKRWFLTDDEAHVFADQRAAIGRGAEVAHLRDVLSGNVEAL